MKCGCSGTPAKLEVAVALLLRVSRPVQVRQTYALCVHIMDPLISLAVNVNVNQVGVVPPVLSKAAQEDVVAHNGASA